LDPDLYFSLITGYAGVIACAAALVLLVVLLWIIAGFEAALRALSPDDAAKMEKEKNRRNEQILAWLQKPDRLWATLSAAGIFACIAATLLAVHLIRMTAGDSMTGWGSFLLIAGGCLFIKKLSAMLASERTLRHISVYLSVFEKIFYPLAVLLAASTAYFYRREQKQQSISIGKIWDKSSETVIENENILKGIVKSGNIDIHTIMTARMDVEAARMEIPFPELIRLINECGYSRLPVFDAHDNVKGILYVKDLLPYIGEGAGFRWQSLIRAAYFVPGNKKIDDLFKEFQEKKIHMAVIIDEYGSMTGIVTLEDVLEEIMGDIADELDDDEPDYEQVNSNTFLFDGKVLLNDFYRILHIEDTIFDEIKGDADTLAGIILELKGEIPQKGDCVNYRNLSFCVEEMENRRIKQIKVTTDEKTD
jgi:gliding motility-associated protein GldE